MRPTVLFIATLISVNTLFAQSYTFSVGKFPFVKLTNAQNLKTPLGPQPKLAMPFKFNVPGIGLVDSLEIYQESLELYIVNEDILNSLALYPMGVAIEDTNQVISADLYAKLEGVQGERVYTIEFQTKQRYFSGTYVYQVKFFEKNNVIKFHYSICPFADKLNNVFAGMEIVNSIESNPLSILYLEGLPEEPVVYRSMNAPYQYLKTCPSDSVEYVFSIEPNGISNILLPNTQVQNTDNGFRISNCSNVKSAKLLNLDGKQVGEGVRISDYIFFSNAKQLSKGVYVIHLIDNNGNEQGLKWAN